MTFPKRSLTAIILAAALGGVIANFPFTPAVAAFSDISLGSAENYVLLAGSAITNGAGTTFAGDGSLHTGISPTLAAPGIAASLLASGSTQFDDGVSAATTAANDLVTAFDFVDSLTVATSQAVISNETLTAGAYGTISNVALAVSGTVTLDGGGDNRSIFIIKTGSALDFAASTTIVLINGAQASNIYWVAGSALTMGATSTVSGNIMARSAMTIGASSVVTGTYLTQGAITLGGSVATTHQLVISYVAPTPTPTPTPIVTQSESVPPPAPVVRPTPVITPYVVVFPTLNPSATFPWTPPLPPPTSEVSLVPSVIPSVEPTVAPEVIDTQTSVQPSVSPSAIASSLPTPNPTDTSTVIVEPSVKPKHSFKSRKEYPSYHPTQHPKSTVNTAIGGFAVLSVLSSGTATSQGYLAQVARGSALAVAARLGRGDRRRIKKTKRSFRFINFFTVIATKVSRVSPLATRTISDASYLRASIGNFSLGAYPAAIGLGISAAATTHFQGLPPTLALVIAMMALGIADALAGFIAGLTFMIAVIASGNVNDLKTFLTLAGILLMSYSPAVLAGTFRPLRRVVNSPSALWERSADYILASILSGWVVKQIATGLPGLSGLQLPIAAHAHQLGVIAGALVFIRFGLEDIVAYIFPDRVRELEPEYRDRSLFQQIASSAMQVLVFTLVAQPFIGWKIELWIGIAIFTAPLVLTLLAEHFPKGRFLDRWLPTGIIEMIVMTLSGFLIARTLSTHNLTPARYVLVAFIVLSLPGFILKVLPLFAGGYESQWRSSKLGNASYYLLGLISLAVLLFIIFSGLLISNTL